MFPERVKFLGENRHTARFQDIESTPPEVADRLSTIYKRYFGEFDTIYVMSYTQAVENRK